MLRKNWWSAAALGLSLTLSAGCGGKSDGLTLAEVTGTVTLDGQPIQGALVEFNPQTQVAAAVSGKSATSRGGSTGLTNADGRFSLQFDKDRKGAIPGVHGIRVTRLPPYDPDDKPAPPDPIPLQYNILSQLTYDVKDGPNTYNLDIKTQ